MLFRRLSALVVASALLAAAPAVAQATLDVNPGVLTQGSVATVTYRNPSLAGQTVVITVNNGARPTPQAQTIEIALDENGKGEATWSVPYWYGAKFNAPDVQEVFCAVVK
jgi:transcriptional accessory protein Tex/SPT6